MHFYAKKLLVARTGTLGLMYPLGAKDVKFTRVENLVGWKFSGVHSPPPTTLLTEGGCTLFRSEEINFQIWGFLHFSALWNCPVAIPRNWIFNFFCTVRDFCLIYSSDVLVMSAADNLLTIYFVSQLTQSVLFVICRKLYWFLCFHWISLLFVKKIVLFLVFFFQSSLNMCRICWWSSFYFLSDRTAT